MKHLLISGIRSYDDRDTLYRLSDEIIDEEMDSVIIVGTGAGVDTLALDYALEHGMELVEFLPEQSDAMISFAKEKEGIALVIWDEEEKETSQLIDGCRKAGIDTRVWSTKSGGFL